MSDRQIAYAATAGRKVTFTSVQSTIQPITGYVCGSDDYHWLVAYCCDDNTGQITTTLVHKGLAPTVTISPVSTLEHEPPAIRAAVEGVGRGFWLFCNREYFGKDEVADEPTDIRHRQHPSPRQQEKTSA